MLDRNSVRTRTGKASLPKDIPAVPKGMPVLLKDIPAVPKDIPVLPTDTTGLMVGKKSENTNRKCKTKWKRN